VKKKPATAGFFISKFRVTHRILDNKKAGDASFSYM
jgi:hypothetical protein